MTTPIKHSLRASKRLINTYFFDRLAWARRRYSAPSPQMVKWQVLLRNSDPAACWVETGTFFGETTKLLASRGHFVFSIEPEPELYARAERKFRGHENVSLINATSEKAFPMLLPTLSGSINFWLDGHYSAGITYQGAIVTPIRDELQQIERNLPNFSKASILIDDVRCFNPQKEEYAGYPSLDFLVDWARRNSLAWHIEHDIFIARKL